MVIHHIAQGRHPDIAGGQYGTAKTTTIGNMYGRNGGDFRQRLPHAQTLQDQMTAV